MALVFAPFVRLNAGKVPFSVGTGACSPSAVSHGLKLNDDGYIFAVMDGVINHYLNGLPFDQYGRLVITQNSPARYSMSVPFSASGAVSGGQ